MIVLDIKFHWINLVAIEVVEVDYLLVTVDYADFDTVDDFLDL